MKGSVSAVGQNLLLWENRLVDLLAAQELGRGINRPNKEETLSWELLTKRSATADYKPIIVESSRGLGAQL